MKGKYCIIRTYSAGVFAGTIKKHKGKEVTITNARRIWYWAGAASLSQLAKEGTSKPKECKFPCAVKEIFVSEAIEILVCTARSKKSISSVPVWSE